MFGCSEFMSALSQASAGGCDESLAVVAVSNCCSALSSSLLLSLLSSLELSESELSDDELSDDERIAVRIDSLSESE